MKEETPSDNPSEDVEKAFENSNKPVNLNAATFYPSFGKDMARNVQWQGQLGKAKPVNSPESFEEMITEKAIF